MKNDDSDANTQPKLGSATRFCSLYNIELVERGVQTIWRPDENGDAEDLLETYSMEAYYESYNCTGCGGHWDIPSEEGRDKIWKEIKEHFNEVSP